MTDERKGSIAGGGLANRVVRLSSGLANAVLSVPLIKKRLFRSWYEYLSSLDVGADVTFMNYGYLAEDLRRGEPGPATVVGPDRYGLQLYRRVAGAVDLRDRDVLEVGCGRGGGSSFMAQSLAPRSVTGIDFSGRAVAFCQKHYRMENLRFLRAEAEHLPFRRESFDAVVNVESSHCYPSMGRFLREVERVLRPGGCFLFADLRARGAVEELREQLRRSGLTVAEEERITPNVLRALEADSERRLALIECKTPRLLRQPFRQFAGVKGSPVYKAFRSGEWEYLRFVLRKDA